MIIKILALIGSIAAFGISVFTYRKYEKHTEVLSEELQALAKVTQEAFLLEIEPLKVAVSRAMGFKSNQATDAKQLKTAEKYISQDLLEAQDPMIVAALELLSPRTKEYLEENPDLIMKLIPRFQALQATGDPLGFLKPGGRPPGGQSHPFGRKEE